MSLSLPSTKPHTTSKSSLSFSLKHVGETTRSRLFGVVLGWSENIPGLFSRLYMSSRYFDESLTLVLGFLYWKELGLDAPIYFLTMDSCKYLGDLIPSDEELLELKFGWLIWIKTQNVDESKMRAILCSCAEQMGRGQSACCTRTVRRDSSWTADSPHSEVRTVR